MGHRSWDVSQQLESRGLDLGVGPAQPNPSSPLLQAGSGIGSGARDYRPIFGPKNRAIGQFSGENSAIFTLLSITWAGPTPYIRN